MEPSATQQALGEARVGKPYLNPEMYPWEVWIDDRFHSRWSNLAAAIQSWQHAPMGRHEVIVSHRESRVAFELPFELREAMTLARKLGGKL